MKKYFYYILLPILLLASCSDSKDDEQPNKTFDTVNEKLNNWTYQQMDTYYYWYKNMPNVNSSSYKAAPKDFYKSLLYSGDRFSYMDYQAVSTRAGSVTTYDLGFHYLAFLWGDYRVNPQTSLFVTYVKPGTLAAGQLHRGDLITHVNGQILKYNNYVALTEARDIVKLTVNYTREVTLFLSQDYQEDPLLLSKTFTVGDKKVGYMIYNHFANGPRNESYSWAVKVNEALTNFKNEGISEMILDLRYNRGGYVESGTYIASAFAPNRNGKIYTKSQYNDKLEKETNFKNRKNNYFKDYITNGGIKYNIPQFDLPRIIVITGKETASASEQIINGLSAYIDVEVLGMTTIGKNQESFELSYDGSEAILSLHPIVSLTYRSDVDDPTKNDYSAGIDPTIGLRKEQFDEVSRSGDWDIKVKEFLEIYPPEASKIPLGDPEEILLKLALDFIKTGNRSPEQEAATSRGSVTLIPKQEVKDDGKSGAILTKIEE